MVMVSIACVPLQISLQTLQTHPPPLPQSSPPPSTTINHHHITITTLYLGFYATLAGGDRHHHQAFSYSDLVLGLCVNAGTHDRAETGDWGEDSEDSAGEHLPFDVATLAKFDFRLRPTNYAFRVKSRELSLYDWNDLRTWYGGQNLLQDMSKQDVVSSLRFQPYSDSSEDEPVVRFPHAQLEDDAGLQILRRHGINLQPVWVDGDGSCLVHAVSTSLTGSQLFYDALRFAIYSELRDHAEHYCTLGLITDDYRKRFEHRLIEGARQAAALGLKDRAASLEEAAKEMSTFNNEAAKQRWTHAAYEDSLEKARPSEGEILLEDRYLEEIHIAAMANVLRRPIMVLGEGYQGGLFLPLRHDPESCRWSDGRANPPLVMYQDSEHYVPLVPQRPQDMWTWAEDVLNGDREALDALRGYERLRDTPSHRIPEWVEEISLYIVARAAEKLNEVCTLYELDADARNACQEAFGYPSKWEELPMTVVFAEQPLLCEKPIKEIDQMTAIFECMNMKPCYDGAGLLRLSLYVHKVDFHKMQRILWALYCLMDTHNSLGPIRSPVPEGVLPIAGNVDTSVWKFVLNFTQKDEINVGLARLYCDPEGWDFSVMCLDERDPRDFLTKELARLKERFKRLTGEEFSQLVKEDMRNQSQMHRAADIRKQLPKALLAMQRVIRERAYPGRGPLCPAQIVIEELPISVGALKGEALLFDEDDIEEDEDDHHKLQRDRTATTSVLLPEADLATMSQRHDLLGHLVSRYGLPQNQFFEQCALAVLLYERFPEARCRQALTDWIVSTARDGEHGNIVVERTSRNVVTKITLRPLNKPLPLPALQSLFPSRRAGVSPPAASCSSPLPTTGSYVLVSHPTPPAPPAGDSAQLDPPLYSLLRRSTSGSSKESPSVSRLRSRVTAANGGGGGIPCLAAEEDPAGFNHVVTRTRTI